MFKPILLKKGGAGNQVAGKSKFQSCILIRFQTIFSISLFLLYLLVPTYTTFIRAHSYQNFHYFNISFDNYLTTICCLSFTGPHYRSSYTCSQPQLATRRSYQLHFWLNHGSPQPSHHSPLSIDPPLLSSSSLSCSSSTQPHINTNIHPSNQTPSCIHNFHCTFTSPTNLSFFNNRHTASLWGYPTQPMSHPPFKPSHLHPQHSLHAHP